MSPLLIARFTRARIASQIVMRHNLFPRYSHDVFRQTSQNRARHAHSVTRATLAEAG
jgi:hypothetical protein